MEQKACSKKRVAVLFGGKSTEHKVSLQSSINIIRVIDRQKYDFILIGVDKQGYWRLYQENSYLINADNPATIQMVPVPNFLAVVPGYNTMQLIDATTGQVLPPIDVVFSVLHGANGENGSVQGMLQVLNIPYTGANVLGSAICMDKDMTKRVLREAGIPVTTSITLLLDDHNIPTFNTIKATLGLPLFIKPASQGSSIGISKVTDNTSFDKALALAFSYDPKVLIEPALNVREIEVAVLGNSNPKISVCGEIIVNNEFYTYDTKYLNEAQADIVIPAPLSLELEANIRRIARQTYMTLGCTVMARVDFFLTNEGTIFVNEVNTLPGFTMVSMYPKLWEKSGITYPMLVDKLIMLALERAHQMENIKVDR